MGGPRARPRGGSALIFTRLATALTLGILAAQAALWGLSGHVQPTVVIPLRPSLMREADALVIDGGAMPAPPLDARTLAAGLASMARIPALALRPQQRAALLTLARDQAAQAAEAGAARPMESEARAFRATFMRITLDLLGALRPAQAAFIVAHNEDFYVTFEAAYWDRLRVRLADPTGATRMETGGQDALAPARTSPR